MGSSSPEAAAAEVGGPVLTPPVTVGPITASSLGGIPFIAVTGPVNQFSGKRLTQFLMAALDESGLTIEPPE